MPHRTSGAVIDGAVERHLDKLREDSTRLQRQLDALNELLQPGKCPSFVRLGAQVQVMAETGLNMSRIAARLDGLRDVGEQLPNQVNT